MLSKKRFVKEVQKDTIIEADNAFIIIGLIEIREAVDRYIEHRIKSDKTLENILKDIYSAVQKSGSQN